MRSASGRYAFKFGTAGIRARLGSAANELNLESVRVIAYAIVRELDAGLAAGAARNLAVAFDGRRQSRAFAEEVCAVALAQGFSVGLFERETPTPLLAFSTRQLKLAGGIMVTASHNPPDDNGIKLYLAGGRQVAAPHDAAIEAGIASAPEPAQIPRADLEGARADGLLRALGEPELTAYLAALRALVPAGAPPRGQLQFGYSALYGVGSEVTRRVLDQLGSLAPLEVSSQALLRADFGGLRSPNPEEPAALAELWALAEREQLTLAFAHDPDADRLAVLARETGGALRALTGDEVGALIGDFLLANHPAPKRTLLVSTLVSGGLLERIARARGAGFARSPTGFKWIAALGRERAEAEQRELLFGYEEALGYAFFGMADDKDGIAALAVLCALARELSARGESLLDRLDALSRAHGVFVARQLSVAAAGQAGSERIARVLGRLRALAPAQLLGPGARRLDDAASALPLLIYEDDADTRLCVRPSGTEPKLKLYLHARELPTDAQDLASARARAEARLDALAARLAPYLAD